MYGNFFIGNFLSYIFCHVHFSDISASFEDIRHDNTECRFLITETKTLSASSGLTGNIRTKLYMNFFIGKILIYIFSYLNFSHICASFEDIYPENTECHFLNNGN